MYVFLVPKTSLETNALYSHTQSRGSNFLLFFSHFLCAEISKYYGYLKFTFHNGNVHVEAIFYTLSNAFDTKKIHSTGRYFRQITFFETNSNSHRTNKNICINYWNSISPTFDIFAYEQGKKI